MQPIITAHSSSSTKVQPIIHQCPQQQTIINRQSFYICIKVDFLKYAQGTIFDNIIKQLKSGKQQNKSSKLKKSSIFDTENESLTKMLFKIQVFEIKNKNKNQRQKLTFTQSIGQIQPPVPNSRIFPYPIDTTQISLSNKSQLNTFIYHFSSHDIFSKQYSLGLSVILSQKQVYQIGECRIDPRIFVQIFLDQGISCLRDTKQLFRQINTNEQNQKQIKQNIQIEYDIYVQRDRLSLQRMLNVNKKGIKIMDFKEHIRTILEEREKLCIKQQQDQNENSISNHNQEVNIEQQFQNNKPKNSTSIKYNKYLKMKIEANLHYTNPRKQLLQKQINQITQQNLQKKKLNQQIERQYYQKNLIKKEQKLSSRQKKSNQITNKQSIAKQGQIFQQANKKISDMIKIAIFCIISAFLLYYVMNPSKNVQIKSNSSQI